MPSSATTAAGFVLSFRRAAVIRIQLRSGSSSRTILGWRSEKPRSSSSMALKTDPAILSPLRKTLLGTPVFIASRRSWGLFATMTTWSLPCRCLRCSSPSGEVYREIPSAPGRASLESSKKAISVLPSSSSTQSASDPLRRVGVCRARLSAGGCPVGF